MWFGLRLCRISGHANTRDSRREPVILARASPKILVEAAGSIPDGLGPERLC